MRTSTLAAALAVALSATGLAALTLPHGATQFPDVPVRAHRTLGPVAVLARPGPDTPAIPLAQAARARYGRIDALARVRTEALPNAETRITGVAILWD